MPACVVNGCSPATRSKDSEVILHVFPKDKDMIKIWLLATGQQYKNLEDFVNRIYEGKKSNTYRMCSNHFSPQSYIYKREHRKRKLTPNAIPSIFTTAEPPAPKRKRLDNMGTFSLKPGERCPTCSQVIPHASSKQPAKRITKQSGGQTMKQVSDQTHGNKNKSLQINPGTFSIRPQGTNLITTSITHLKQRTDTKESEETTSETIFQNLPESALPVVEPAGSFQVSTSSPARIFIDDSKYTIQAKNQAILPEIPLSNIPFVTRDIRQEEKSTFFNESRPLKEPDSPFHISQLSEPKLLAKDDSEDFINKELPDEHIFSEREFDNQIPSYVNPVKQQKFIVFESCLDELILKLPCQSQNRCSKPIRRIVKKKIGSFISVYVECSDRHYYRVWESQPITGCTPLGNIMMAAGIVSSGNTFIKMQQFFNLCNILSIAHTSYSNYQRDFIFPTIDYFWKANQMENLGKIQNRAVCITGDRQCDSRGPYARYCVYSLLDIESKKIISFDIQQIKKNSSSLEMEKTACKNALDFLVEQDINVKLLCTDQHAAIGRMIREKYGTITHEIDLRHIATTVGKRILAASKRKKCEDLAQWVSSIKKHLWWCSSTGHHDDTLLISKWNSLLYHVQNIHQWEDREGESVSCQHDKLTDHIQQKRKWLHEEGAAFQALKKIVLDKRLQKDIKHICYFCHTGDLEVYHSSLLKYRETGQHFSMDEIKARTRLAALDHNKNCGRIQAVVKRVSKSSASSDQYQMACSKARKEWNIKAIYELTNQDFLIDLITEVVERASGNHTFDWRSRISTESENVASLAKPDKESLF